MQIDIVSAPANVAPTTEAAGGQPESAADGSVSFADLLNAAAGSKKQDPAYGEETLSPPADDEDKAPVDDWMTVPVFVPLVPVIAVANTIEARGTGADTVPDIGNDEANMTPVDASDVAKSGNATSSDNVAMPVAGLIDGCAQPLIDAKQPAKPTADHEKSATISAIDVKPLAASADVHAKAVESTQEPSDPATQPPSERETSRVSKDASTDTAGKPGVPTTVASIPNLDSGSEAAKAPAPDAVVSSPATGAQREIAASPATGASESSSDVTPKSKSVATRFARALERVATPASVQRAAEDSAEGASSNAGSGNQPSLGEQLREQLPQIAAGRGQSAAMPAVSPTGALPNDARLSNVFAASHSASQATALQATLPNEHDVTLQIVQSLRMQFRDGIGEAVLTLKPEHLGSVSISLRIENGGLKANVQAEVPAVRQWLESQQDTLRNALAEQGLRLDRFDVEPDARRQASSDDAQERSQRKRHERKPLQSDEPIFEVVV